MNTLLNILWLIFGAGLVIFVEYLIGGLLLCLTVVGIPFGLQCFKIAFFGLWPFGRRVTEAPAAGNIGCVFNVIWLVFAGFWIFLTHLGLALGLAVTIIGIPFALQHFKVAMLALTPFGRDVVDA